MIAQALRLLKLAPWLALAAIGWLFLDMRSEIREQDADLFRLEQDLSDAGAEIDTIRREAAAAAERQAKAISAVEAELERQTVLASRYRAARDSLEGLDDGEVAPVLSGALEALR